MRLCLTIGLFAFLSPLAAAAQGSCVSGQLAGASANANATRRSLLGAAVRESDMVVPAGIGALLVHLKDDLALVAGAAFACASPSATPEQLQATLTEALHANVPANPEEVPETRNRQDVGAYGSELAVQVFELFGAPRILEVDFRYGIECGDDHLLLIFAADPAHAANGWQQQLRWSTPAYRTVGDAIGDFVLLTPLTGNDQHPVWHYLVAHGHPACGDTPRPSTFSLDLLTPTADPARPAVDWHFQHAYTEGASVPRLATTEDTIDFRLTPETPASGGGKPSGPPPGAPAIYRFHLTSSGRVEPLPLQNSNEVPATPRAAGTAAAAPSSTRH